MPGADGDPPGLAAAHDQVASNPEGPAAACTPAGPASS